MSITKANNNENGASVVEFAVVLPLLLLLLFGIIEFGIILFDQAMLTNASREGARAGIVAGDDRLKEPGIQGVVNDYCEGHLITFGSSPAPPTTTALFTDRVTGDEITFEEIVFGDNLTVTVEFIYDFLLVPSFIPGLPHTITLKAVSVMKYE